MVSMKDYEDKNGEVDWKAYRQAQVDAGEKCYKCNTYVMFSKGFRTLCSDCISLGDKGEISHDSFIRCPKCKESWDPSYSDDFEVYQDGDHEVHCSECQHKFQITTHVSYTFCSPALIEEPREEETEDE